MLTDQRRQIILDRLRADGQVASGALARRFGLSEDTIRRDLRALAKEGLCRRTYGGAVAPGGGPIEDRLNRDTAEKSRLATRAVQLIRPGQTVLIDAGSTNAAVAGAIPEGLGLTVVTNALGIADALARRRDMSLVVLGGAFAPDSGACTGPETLAAVQGLSVDLMFLGTCALDVEAGVTAFDPVQAQLKQAMIGVARKVAAAVTVEKLGSRAPYRVAPAARLDWLVADAPMGWADLVVL